MKKKHVKRYKKQRMLIYGKRVFYNKYLFLTYVYKGICLN